MCFQVVCTCLLRLRKSPNTIIYSLLHPYSLSWSQLLQRQKSRNDEDSVDATLKWGKTNVFLSENRWSRSSGGCTGWNSAERRYSQFKSMFDLQDNSECVYWCQIWHIIYFRAYKIHWLATHSFQWMRVQILKSGSNAQILLMCVDS